MAKTKHAFQARGSAKEAEQFLKAGHELQYSVRLFRAILLLESS
jgi:hypothetical protein